MVLIAPSVLMFLAGSHLATWLILTPMAVANWMLAEGNLVDKMTLAVATIVMLAAISLLIWKAKGMLAKILVSGAYHLYCGFVFIFIVGSVG